MAKPKQIQREWMTDAQWAYVSGVLFPTLKALKARIEARKKEMEEAICHGEAGSPN